MPKLKSIEFRDKNEWYDICFFVETKLGDFDGIELTDDYVYMTKDMKKCGKKTGGIAII